MNKEYLRRLKTSLLGPFSRAMTWSIALHVAVFASFSVSSLFVPRGVSPRTILEWRPIQSSIEVHPVPPPFSYEGISPVKINTSTVSLGVSAETRRKIMKIGRTERTATDDSLFMPRAEPASFGDLPASYAAGKERLPDRIRPVTDPVVNIPDPSSIPVSKGISLDWRSPAIPSARGVSAGSLGVEGPQALVERRVVYHTWPTWSGDASIESTAVFRFLVTKSGRVSRIIPEVIGDAEWLQLASEALLKWRFAPLPPQDKDEVWGRIRMGRRQ